jgi:hypothetical protein
MMETVYDFRPKEDLSKYLVMANDEFPDATIALQQGDIPLFSIGDISTITGLPKSRKTFLFSSLVAGFLKPDGFMSVHSELDEKRLLFVDTEQSRRFVWLLVKRIYRLMEWNYNDPHTDVLRVMALRELTPEKRWDVIKKSIDGFRPNLVFIDGSADLLNDTNSMEESNHMVNELMRLSSEKQCHICSVVHTNPNSDKTRGHWGSELQRKSETVMLVSRDGETTSVKPQFTRNMEFTPFAFRVNDRGLPEPTEVIIPNQEDLTAIFKEIYSYAQFLSYGDLRQRLMSNLGKGKTACSDRIKKAIDAKIIYRDIEGNYRLYYEATPADLPFKSTDEPLPF